ncbi:MAG: hypothetical protein AAF957_28830 [Planctomycetota bacterium]
MTTHRLVPLVAAACALVLVTAFLALRDGRPGVSRGASIERRSTPSGDASSGAGAPGADAASAGARSAVENEGGLASLGGGSGDGAEDEPDLVHVFVRTPEGEAVLDRPSPLPISLTYFVRPRVVRAPAAPKSTRGLDAPEVPPYRVGGSYGPGHFGRVPRPRGPAFAVLTLGQLVVASAPFVDGVSEVVLVVDPDEVVDRTCTITGSIPGVTNAAELVRVRCVDVGLMIETPFTAVGSGESFEVTGVPPGPVRLTVAPTAARVVRGIARRARETDAGPMPFGARVRDEENWRFRLAALGSVAQPRAEVELTLEPGQARDLGALAVESASAVLLRLGGEEGQPRIRAGSGHVRLLGRTESGQPWTWSFEDELLVLPLPQRRCELLVLAGGQGALVEVTPRALPADGPPAPLDVTIEQLSIVRMPAAATAELRTTSGGVIPGSDGWVGGTYCGVDLDGTTRLVPPGDYAIFEGAGAPGEAFEVTGGQLVEVTEGGIVARSLGGSR